jgi:hypothetical protein
MNMNLLSVSIERHHCYNKEVVSVGTYLNFTSIIPSFPVLFWLLLTAGGILHPDVSVSMFICYFPCNQTSWNQETQLNSAKKK